MKVMRIAGAISAIILLVYAILLIGQIWGSWMSIDNFIKLTITAAISVVTIGIVALIYRELVEEKQLKKDDFID